MLAIWTMDMAKFSEIFIREKESTYVHSFNVATRKKRIFSSSDMSSINLKCKHIQRTSENKKG